MTISVVMLGRSGEDLSFSGLPPQPGVLLRFMERNEYSWQLMLYLCGENVAGPESLLRRTINWWRSLGATPFERRMARVTATPRTSA